MASLSTLISSAKARYKKWEDGADDRARAKLAKIAIKSVREAHIQNLRIEKLKRRQALEEQIANLKKAELRRKKVEKEIRHVGNGSFLSRLIGEGKTKSKAKRRATTKRKTSRKRTQSGR